MLTVSAEMVRLVRDADIASADGRFESDPALSRSTVLKLDFVSFSRGWFG